MESLRILVLEDEPADAELALQMLLDAGIACAPTVVAARAQFERAVAGGGFELVLADYSLPGYTGLEALEHVRRRDALLPFILLSGALGEERAVDALRAGATDYVLKDRLARLPSAVRRALEERRARERHLATQLRLQQLSRRLLEVQERERRHLARELHDDIGQALTALKIQLESLALTSGAGALRERLAESAETTRHALERVRLLSLSLRPPQLDDLGLVAALRSHLDRQAAVGRLIPHFEAEDVPRALPPVVETACFRIAQEAINNVLRHAAASNIWLRLFVAGEKLALSVRDDGRGFDPETALRGAAGGASLGLASMEERATLAGGALQLRSAAGQGTVLLATFGLERTAAEPGTE